MERLREKHLLTRILKECNLQHLMIMTLLVNEHLSMIRSNVMAAQMIHAEASIDYMVEEYGSTRWGDLGRTND